MQTGHETASRTARRKPWRRVRRFLARLHDDQRGAEGLEKLLIIAAIVIPLLGLLIVFRNELTEWVRGGWDDIIGDDDIGGG